MSIEVTTASGPPASVHKVGTGFARQRSAGADNPGAASFMDLLQVHAVSGADPGLVEVEAASASGGLGTVDNEPAAQAAADAMDGAAPLVTPALVGAPPAQPRAAVARPSIAGAVLADDAHVGEESAAASAADTKDLQAWHAVSDDAACTGPKRHGGVAGDAGLAARQVAAESALAAREGALRADAAASDKVVTEASLSRASVTPPVSASAGAVMSMFEAGLVGLRAGPGGRFHEPGGTRLGNASESVSGGFVPWVDAGAGNSVSQAASPVYAPTAATPVPAAALAQKLHFWVSGGVQSAELQLDAFDGGSVDVHIAVKGEQAYVEFRSDQPQARKLLLDTMPQLKELLAGEGLMLSGGFVGGSAQHAGEGGSARPDRFPTARAAQARVAEGVAAAVPPQHATMGSAVDLFV